MHRPSRRSLHHPSWRTARYPTLYAIGSSNENVEPAPSIDVTHIRPRLAPGLVLDLVIEPDLPPVAADADKLRQILINLRENAIKYSPDGGRVLIALSRQGSVVRFEVQDQGLGIAEDELPHIFERFHRVDPNMTRGVGGTGLGLYICRELVEGMRGRMWVTSIEGAGSTFSFELPIA